MKKLCWTTISAVALSAVFGEAPGQKQTAITTPWLPLQDCTALEGARSSSPEAYGAYTRCIIDNNYFAFHALYTLHLRDFPHEEQDVVAKFRVGTDGNVESAEAAAPGISDSKFLTRVAMRIKLIKFLPSGAGAQEVSHAFKFRDLGRR
jgi:hypothetical protein